MTNAIHISEMFGIINLCLTTYVQKIAAMHVLIAINITVETRLLFSMAGAISCNTQHFIALLRKTKNIAPQNYGRISNTGHVQCLQMTSLFIHILS